MIDSDGTGDVAGATPDPPTYVHGDSPAPGPKTTQGARSRTGERGRERRMVPKERPTSYYGRPVVRPPVWTWEIPTYFFTGGLGGASSVLAYAAERAGNRCLARSAWISAFAGIAVSPALLTSDLGRPLRFINMLRVFKVTSPMSVGSWVLTLAGAAVAPAAAYGVLGWPRAGRWAQPVAAALGLPVATYTAVLLSNTAVPVWSEARWHLPISFASSAAASAGAAATMLTPADHAAPARRLAIGGAVIESVATELMEKRLGEQGEPYREVAAGKLATAAKVLTVAGAAVLALGAKRSRPAAIAGAGMLLVGSLCERWTVFRAGFQSAEDPKYTVGPQRSRVDAR
jgi:formate-dependent nitrite reductase membrane component NrfD